MIERVLDFMCWTVPVSRLVEHLDTEAFAEATTSHGLLFRNDSYGMKAMQSRAKPADVEQEFFRRKNECMVT
jgi:hypothetical protein